MHQIITMLVLNTTITEKFYLKCGKLDIHNIFNIMLGILIYCNVFILSN